MERSYLHPLPLTEELGPSTIPKGEKTGEQVSRETIPCTHANDHFVIISGGYQRQYSHLYLTRLHMLKDVLINAARDKWGHLEDVVFAKRLLDIQPDTPAVIVGTVYKEMARKPSILEEFSKDRLGKTDIEEEESYVAEEDELVVEDESGRVKLLLDPSLVATFPTGIVAAWKGIEDQNMGCFRVEDVVVAGLPPLSVAPERAISEFSAQDHYVMFVSGLKFESHDGMHAFRRKLLLDFLYGIGIHHDHSEMAKLSASIGRVIICGGLLHMPLSLDYGEWKKPLSSDVTPKDLAAMMGEVDEFLSLVGGAVPCDVIPSREDPTNLNLPQQRINPRLVPRSEAVGTVHFGTNPFRATLGKELDILGTSGDNVRNVRKFAKLGTSAMMVEGKPSLSSSMSDLEGTSTEIEIMRRMLSDWRHLAPVAPDTLGCFPFSGNDPLVIEQCPHVFFTGGASRFDTAIMDSNGSSLGIRLISVPSFAETGVVALLNLKDLSCIPFKICSF
eukprot:TRINITY_DN15123_c0_g1_i1.p1 TRINITY_DN15123_c0_g1~~TRINITY_DN15123_c0_g1_i1.p1  ORF type:complete len:525 (-),score=130.60 TRINITY_DN15123_c0_g1_i1:60-1565(-)